VTLEDVDASQQLIELSVVPPQPANRSIIV